ncbi:hypothetical protein CEQ90_05270 [Lewinellaceae bacterium SD302]|nr:hypothetical protein CEQ90_05270 [Lewinellaceae bacterium SD302]
MDTCSFFTATTNLKYATNDIAVYPNPTAGVLNFKFDSQYQECEIVITNLNGQKLLSAINQPNLNISDLPRGVYLVTFNIDEQVVVKKFTKM